MSELMLDVSQAVELKMAFRRAGYTNAQIKQLSEGNILAQVKNVLRGLSSINPISHPHIIDCDADPFIPEPTWKIKEHRKDGLFKWVADEVLYCSESDTDGNSLYEKLHNQPVLNANVLDYLLKYPELIPETWKNKNMFFWGTIYCESDGSFLSVRSLYWDGTRWAWVFNWLHNRRWRPNDFTILRRR